jgi:hypothetical protein
MRRAGDVDFLDSVSGGRGLADGVFPLENTAAGDVGRRQIGHIDELDARRRRSRRTGRWQRRWVGHPPHFRREGAHRRQAAAG